MEIAAPAPAGDASNASVVARTTPVTAAHACSNRDVQVAQEVHEDMFQRMVFLSNAVTVFTVCLHQE